MLDLGSPLLDLALWALDFPKVESVTSNLLRGGKTWNAARPGVEDYAAAQLKLAPDVSVQLACSWKAPTVANAKIELNFFGTHGGACFHNVNGSRYDFAADHFQLDRSRRPLADAADLPGRRAPGPLFGAGWLAHSRERAERGGQSRSVPAVCPAYQRHVQRHRDPAGIDGEILRL